MHPSEVSVLSGKLPPRFPLLRSVQHQIDFIPEGTIPHHPHCRWSPTQYEELKHQVEEVVISGLSLNLRSSACIFSKVDLRSSYH